MLHAVSDEPASTDLVAQPTVVSPPCELSAPLAVVDASHHIAKLTISP
jgi:hypothetical protein